MNKTQRLSKSGIEYLDLSWGIWSGCRNLQMGVCPVKACWAKSITKRFRNHYPNGFEPTFYPEALESPQHIKKPSLIGVGWVGDVIGYGLDYKEKIYRAIERCPQHTFLFLTKNPQQLIKWSPFPENCWVGVTITHREAAHVANFYLPEISARVKYISFEPLLDDVMQYLYMETLIKACNWLIIGGQTKPTVLPKLEWVQEIVEAADRAGVKVFLKDNLKWLEKRQEMPKGV